jgi:hypothetical protein
MRGPEKRHFFCRKLATIAENLNHNIDPRGQFLRGLLLLYLWITTHDISVMDGENEPSQMGP